MSLFEPRPQVKAFLAQRGDCICCGRPDSPPRLNHMSELERPPRFFCQPCQDDPSNVMAECRHGAQGGR